jgi:DNA-binding response OmpR family regulator
MCIDTAPRSGVCVMLGPRVVLGRDAAFVVQDAEAVLRSGIALSLKMEHVYAGVALVLMTGFPEERKSARSLRDLVDRVLAKPFTKDELLAAVAPILGRTR